MNKEILIISGYFPPETGAAANRMYSISENLGKAGYNVIVVCPLPNYPTGKIFKEYRGKFTKTEETAFGKITHLWVWPSNATNKFVRLLSMVSFSFSLMLYFLFRKTPKTVFVQYSPVFVGFTAVFLGRLFSKKIILNVSDLWPLAGLEMGILKKGLYYSQLLKMERYCYHNATAIMGQSKEILRHISTFESEKPLFLYRNIPDFKLPILQVKNPSEELKIVYAGLLGVAQGIFQICQKIHFPSNVHFHIYGAGPEAEKIKQLQQKNVFFHGELDRKSLHKKILEYDIAFIPLAKRIYGSVPSKLFEYSRLGLPLLYFAGGEGGNLVEQHALGWVVPEADFKALQSFLNSLSAKDLMRFPKEEVQKNSIAAFNFKSQFEAFIAFIEKN